MFRGPSGYDTDLQHQQVDICIGIIDQPVLSKRWIEDHVPLGHRHRLPIDCHRRLAIKDNVHFLVVAMFVQPDCRIRRNHHPVEEIHIAGKIGAVPDFLEIDGAGTAVRSLLKLFRCVEKVLYQCRHNLFSITCRSSVRTVECPDA